jgi:membrane protein
MKRLIEIGFRLSKLYRKEIWSSSHLKDNSPRGWLYAGLRVTSITWTVFNETKIPARAAALSFGSLLGLGPLVAIAVLIGGFVLGKDTDPSLIANRLGELMEQVAPQLRQLNSLDASGNLTSTAASPEVVKVISDIIAAARSGVGVAGTTAGAFSIVLIVLLLFKSIEDAFNDIWGVRVGRSLLMRIVFYWTTLTLGAVLFFSSLALLGASAAVNVFQQFPGGSDLQALLRWMLPAFSLTFLVGMLTLVYRAVPNTHVFWRAAFVGAVVVAALLLLNNVVALLYVRRVVLERSLYGSLAIFPVFMLGLYIFWLYVLIGGVISYAVQNVHFRNSQAAWGSLSESMRERLSLVVLLTIGRRFQNCLPATSAAQLADMLKVPTQILNECLNRLVLMELITTLRPVSGTSATEYLYQPARPLNRISLNEFKSLDDNFGDDPIGQALEQMDPILHHYNDALEQLGHQSFFKKSLEELFLEHPFKDSKPSLKTGNRP